jgi:thiamine-phosphate pyrophosphorylase
VANLYPLVDVDACFKVGIEPLALALHWVSLGIVRLQVRAKSLGSGDYLRLLQQIVSTLPKQVEVFANDRPDLAEIAGCFGVHVGQGDLPVQVVKQTFPKLRVGVSTHDRDQLVAALNERPCYVAFGPVFATGSKQNPEPCVGLGGLQDAYEEARAASIPLVAIGGISVDNIAKVAMHCDLVALISALTARELAVVSERYGELLSALRGG